MRFQEDEKVTFYKGPPSLTCYPPQGPIGATLGTAMNNFNSSPNKVSTHYITTIPLLGVEKIFEICMVLALWAPPPWPPRGPHILFEQFWIPYPKVDSCQVWLKSNHAFSRRRWKCEKFTDDGRRDARRTAKITWAFGSGELKILIYSWLLDQMGWGFRGDADN